MLGSVALGRRLSTLPSRLSNATTEFSVFHLSCSPHPPPPPTPTHSKRTTLTLSSLLSSFPSQIHVRDVLTLNLHNPASSRSTAAILPRGSATLIHVGHVKAVSTSTSAYLFDAGRPEVQLLSHTLDRAIQGADQETPFELIVLEEILRDVCDTYHRRVRLYQPVVAGVLDGVSNDVDLGVHRLVPLKDSLGAFEMDVKGVMGCIVEILGSDEDMTALLLTHRQSDPTLHQAVELLLEDYNRQLHQTLSEIHYLQKRVQTTQELMTISLDSYRNRMINMNVHLSIAAVCLGVCTTVAGYFGMNLSSGMEEDPWAFWPVVGASSALGAGIYGSCASYLSGGRVRDLANERAMEVQAVTGVLGDMGSLDYAVKRVIEEKEVRERYPVPVAGDGDLGMAKEEFREMMKRGRGGKDVTDAELELIFHILDSSGDGVLEPSEFSKLNLQRGKGRTDDKDDKDDHDEIQPNPYQP